MASDSDLPVNLDRSRLWFYRTWTTVGVGVLLWAVVRLIAGPARYVLPALLFAAVIVYLLHPPITWLQQHRVPRPLGAVAAYLLSIALLTAAIWALVPTLSAQITEFSDRLPALAVDLQNTINATLVSLNIDGSVSLDPHAQETRDAVTSWFAESGDDVGVWLRRVASIGGFLAEATIMLVVGPVIAFYLLLDLPRVSARLRRWIPTSAVAEVTDVAGQVGRSVARYLRGQLILATTVGVLTGVGAAIVGVPYALMVGLVAGVTNLVPMLGPWVGGTFGVLLALTLGGGAGQALVFAAVVLVIQQLESNVLGPPIVGRAVSLHPATIAVTLLGAGAAGGLGAMIIAVPCVAATKLVVLHILSHHTRWGRSATAEDALGQVGPKMQFDASEGCPEA